MGFCGVRRRRRREVVEDGMEGRVDLGWDTGWYEIWLVLIDDTALGTR